MKAVTKYVAFDEKEFESAESCKAYEAEHVEARVVGLTIEQVRAAIAGEDTDLRDALEEVGRRCSVARRDAGEFRRKPKAARTAPPDQQHPAGSTPATDQDAPHAE